MQADGKAVWKSGREMRLVRALREAEKSGENPEERFRKAHLEDLQINFMKNARVHKERAKR